jgi:hypothetical protein
MTEAFLHHTVAEKSVVYDKELHPKLLEAVSLITTDAVFYRRPLISPPLYDRERP